MYALFVFTGCDRDPYPLSFEYFDVNWRDLNRDGKRNFGDEFYIDVRVNTNDPDPDDQYITQYELTYAVNGRDAGVLDSREDIRSNSLGLEFDVAVKYLTAPGLKELKRGDEIEFRFWAADNCDTWVEDYYSFEIE